MADPDIGGEDDYPALRAREMVRRKSREMVDRLSGRMERRQKQIAAELSELAGLPREMKGSLTEQVTLAADTLREAGAEGWQGLVSEFWRLQHSLYE